jgi:hypothetical protein
MLLLISYIQLKCSNGARFRDVAVSNPSFSAHSLVFSNIMGIPENA